MAGKEAAVLDYFSILMKYGPGLVLMFMSLHVTCKFVNISIIGSYKMAATQFTFSFFPRTVPEWSRVEDNISAHIQWGHPDQPPQS
jgi:hypothetical protein